jgi:amino acid transporter
MSSSGTTDRQAKGDGTGNGEPPGPRSLKPNALGVVGVVFLVVSAQAPLTGIAGTVPLSVAVGNGAGVPASFLATGVIILLFSVGFVAMGRHVVNAGAFYAYIGRGLGLAAGTAGAFTALFGYSVLQAGMYGLYSSTVNALGVQYLHVDVPWWAIALVTMAMVQGLGAAGIEVGTKVMAVFVLAETGILLAFGLVVLFSGGGPQGLALTEAFSAHAALHGAPGIALMFAVASMIGFEATAIYGEEARNPQRTVPRATYLAVAVITGFFAFVSWMLIAEYGPAHAQDAAGDALTSGDSAAFVFGPVSSELGGWAGRALPVLFATSLLAGILAFHNSAGRYYFSLGRERLLPRALSRLNRHRAPWVAGAVQTATAMLLVVPFALAGKDPVLALFSWFTGLAVVAILLLYFLTSVSVVVFFRRERPDTRLWNCVIAPVLSVFGIGGALYLVLANFTTLIGDELTTAIWLLASVPAVLLAGIGWSLLRARRC